VRQPSLAGHEFGNLPGHYAQLVRRTKLSKDRPAGEFGLCATMQSNSW